MSKLIPLNLASRPTKFIWSLVLHQFFFFFFVQKHKKYKLKQHLNSHHQNLIKLPVLFLASIVLLFLQDSAFANWLKWM